MEVIEMKVNWKGMPIECSLDEFKQLYLFEKEEKIIKPVIEKEVKIVTPIIEKKESYVLDSKRLLDLSPKVHHQPYRLYFEDKPFVLKFLSDEYERSNFTNRKKWKVAECIVLRSLKLPLDIPIKVELSNRLIEILSKIAKEKNIKELKNGVWSFGCNKNHDTKSNFGWDINFLGYDTVNSKMYLDTNEHTVVKPPVFIIKHNKTSGWEKIKETPKQTTRHRWTDSEIETIKRFMDGVSERDTKLLNERFEEASTVLNIPAYKIYLTAFRHGLLPQQKNPAKQTSSECIDTMIKKEPLVPKDTLNKIELPKFPYIYPLALGDMVLFEGMIQNIIGNKSNLTLYSIKDTLKLTGDLEWSNTHWTDLCHYFMKRSKAIATYFNVPDNFKLIQMGGVFAIHYGG